MNSKHAKLERVAEMQILFAMKAIAHCATTQLIAAGMTEQEAKTFTYDWMTCAASSMNHNHITKQKQNA